MNREKLIAQLTVSEGRRNAAYLDSVGILSIGIGHNCVAKPVAGVTKVGDRISDELLEELFDADVNEAILNLDNYLPWWSALDDVRQNVMIDMCFNMGIGTLRTFVNTLRAIEQGEYKAAAAGMRKSLWAKQVGKRAEHLAKMMETGEW